MSPRTGVAPGRDGDNKITPLRATRKRSGRPVAVALTSPGAVATPSPRTGVDPSLYSGLQWRNIGPRGTTLEDELNAVQDALYQSKPQAGEDPLNFPIKLNDKISALLSVIESVDGVPTDQSFQVFDELNAQLQTQLKKLRDTVGTDVPSFNQLIQQYGMNPISCQAV